MTMEPTPSKTITEIKARQIIKEASNSFSKALAKYHDTTIERTLPVYVTKKGRVLVDTKKTLVRLVDRISRFSIVYKKLISPDSWLVQSISFSKGQFRVLSCAMHFESNMSHAAPFVLEVVQTNMIISKHSIQQFLIRNNTADYRHCLLTLGKAIDHIDTQIMEKMQFEATFPVGFQERQIKCCDNGYAIYAIENPEEMSYRHIKLTIITYISPDMVRSWNREKEMAPFEVGSAETSKFLQKSIVDLLDQLTSFNDENNNDPTLKAVIRDKHIPFNEKQPLTNMQLF